MAKDDPSLNRQERDDRPDDEMPDVERARIVELLRRHREVPEAIVLLSGLTYGEKP